MCLHGTSPIHRPPARRTSGKAILHTCWTSRCVDLTSHEWPVSCQNASGTCTRWNLRTSCCAAIKSFRVILASRSSRGRLSACNATPGIGLAQSLTTKVRRYQHGLPCHARQACHPCIRRCASVSADSQDCNSHVNEPAWQAFTVVSTAEMRSSLDNLSQRRGKSGLASMRTARCRACCASTPGRGSDRRSNRNQGQGWTAVRRISPFLMSVQSWLRKYIHNAV